MELSQILSFTFVALLLVVSPGPNGVLIAKTVPTAGRGAGFANVFGFVAAFYLHGLLSILGVSLLLMQSAQAFFVLKMLGAAYLCWIGVKALLSAWGSAQTSTPVTESPAVTKSRRSNSLVLAFIEGFLTNALNPKVSMFYLAAFPQFIPQSEAASSALLLVSMHALLNFAWFSGMVILFSRLAGAASGEVFQRALKTLTGFIFIGFGLKLASTRI